MNNKLYLTKLLLAILLCNFTILYSQYVVIDDAIPECYTFFYKVEDLCQPVETYWDKSSDNNVYGNANYHGGNNQQWIIIPTYPGSYEVMFINRKNGSILDRSLSQHSLNNLYCYTAKHTGKGNQLFKVDQRSAGQFAIECKDVYKLIDRATSNNNLYCGTPHYGDNQRFHFTNMAMIPNSHNLNVFNQTENIALPPQPISLTDPGTSSDVKHNYTLVSETIIPFAYVEENGRDYAWQAANSPYYRLRRYQYYKLVEAKSVGFGLGETIKNTYTIGCTQTENNSVKMAIGIEMTIHNGATIGDPTEATVNVGYNLATNWGIEWTTSYSTQLVEQISNETTFTKNTETALRIFIYRLVSEYKLYRIYGNTPVLEWDLTADNNHCWMSYPYTDIKFNNNYKAGGIIYSIYTQSAPCNLIPRMYSNYSKAGTASASSYLSSSYAAWKAFDGENKSGTNSRWISSSSNPYSTQWLKYEFNQPVTIMAYCIMPETGGCIDRSPNTWSLQGSDNGTMWLTIDSRSGYSISDWQSEPSRQFTVQYPKKFKSYRLVIYSVNGSTVVSIQKFKIFGKDAGSSQKSTDVDDTYINQIKEPTAELEIYPNPNKGNFTLEFHNIESIKKNDLIDSLQYINLLKSEISFEDKKIDIYDLNGQLIHSLRTDKDILNTNIDGIDKGVYIIKVNINQTILTQRFIID